MTIAQEERQGFTIMGYEPDENRSWEGHPFFTQMEEATGVHISEFRMYHSLDEYNAAKAAAFETGDLPDAFFKGMLTVEEERTYAASGQLVDLAPLLPEYAPNMSRILSARSDWQGELTQPNGVISSLPGLSAYERQCYIWINKNWLDTLGLAMPTNADELTSVLSAFKTGDPNQNGRNDEVPLSFVGTWEAKFLAHAFGIVANDYNIYTENGAVKFAPEQDGFRKFALWMAELNAAGLIDRDAFRQSQSQRTSVLSEAATATLGCFVSIAPYTLYDIDLSEQYIILPPLEYQGETVYRKLIPSVVHGTFAITSVCEDIPAMLAFADYLYSEEGGRLATTGIQDVDYRILEDGTWEWIIPEYGTIDALLRERVMCTDSISPGLVPADFQRRTSLAIEARVRREGDAMQSTLVTPYAFNWNESRETDETINGIQYNLGRLVDEGVARFITGEIPLTDDSWDEFILLLKDNGAEELVDAFRGLGGTPQ
jgi:putative aldouronate transport system substrate-binding protein